MKEKAKDLMEAFDWYCKGSIGATDVWLSFAMK
jgi:hypothetical protein